MEDESAEEKTYELFLVTNRHVFEGYEKAFIRFNPKADEAARDYELMLVESEEVKWHAHPDLDVDVAVISINARFLRKNDIQFNYFRSDEHLVDRKRASELGFTEVTPFSCWVFLWVLWARNGPSSSCARAVSQEWLPEQQGCRATLRRRLSGGDRLIG